MAAPKRSDFERENDYRRITDMYLQGKTQADIAATLGLARQQIGYDLAIIQKRWRTDTAINMDEAKQRELARIDLLEREYWNAWQRTLEERTKTRTEQSSATGEPDKKVKAKGTAKATIEKETMLGNPAYLAGVMSCIERRCKILGLDAAIKSDSVSKNVDLSKLTNQQLARVAAGEDVLQVILSGYVDSVKG